MHLSRLSVLLLLATLVRAATAHAQGGTEVERARSLFVEGTVLARGGEWKLASERFASSSALRPHAVTTYNRAFCEQSALHFTRARSLFLAAVAEHEARGNAELSAEMLQAILRYLAELDSQIARVDVTLEEDGTRLAMDGRPLAVLDAAAAPPVLVAGTREPGPAEAPLAARFQLQVDPGPHTVVLERPDRGVRITRELAFTDGGFHRLDVRVEPAKTPVPEAPAAPLAAKTGAATDLGSAPTAIYVALAVGAAGVITGSVTGGIAFAREAELRDACPEKQCLGPAASSLESAQAWADVATVSFIVGGIGLATAGALWLLSKPDQSQVALTPWVGVASAACSGRF